MILLPDEKKVTFIYKGRKYVAYGQFVSHNFNANSGKITGDGIKTTPKDYSYEGFYKQAQRHGAGEADIFMNNKRLVVPCSRQIFQLSDKCTVY
jgi:hypothetical protein